MATKKSPKKTSTRRPGTSPGRLSIKFHREIYKDAAVKEAAWEYSPLADFSFSGCGKYTTVVIAPKKGPLPERIAEEFSNMALYNSI